MKKATRIVALILCLLLLCPAAFAKVTIITIANDRLAAQEQALKEACPLDIEFEMIGVPDTDIISKVQIDAMSGTNQYDLISTGMGAVQLGLSGIAEELEPLPDWEDIFQGTRESYMYDGKIYGYPVQADTCFLFYRPSLLKAAGYEAPPTTWAEFQEMAVKLTTDVNGKHPDEEGFDPENVEVYGAEFHGGNFNSNSAEFLNYFLSFGAETLAVDASANTYEVHMNSPEALEALTFIVDNYKKYRVYPKGTVNYDWAEHHTMFIEGKVAMAVNYAYMYDLSAAEDSAIKDDFAACIMPAGPAGIRTNVGGWVVSLAKGSKNKEEAKALLEWLASAEGSIIWSDFQGALPTRASVVDDRIASYEGTAKGKYIAAAENLACMYADSNLLSGASYDSIIKVFNSTVNSALASDISPKDALDSAQAQIEEILVKNKFMQ